jgi:hypothetical protein
MVVIDYNTIVFVVVVVVVVVVISLSIMYYNKNYLKNV